jgi:hypothetical protein
MNFFTPLIAAFACLVALVPVSLAVEALRRRPRRPGTLAWAPEIPIEYAAIGPSRVRYIKSGSGPNLVLLHTLRTQLDIFQKVISELAKHFHVYDRQRDRALIPGVTMERVPNGGHFLCLDRPQEFQDLIIRFASDHYPVERAAG